jgi:hypothetical protein
MNIPLAEIAVIVETAPIPFTERQLVATHFATRLMRHYGKDFDSAAFLKLTGLFDEPKGGSGPGIAETAKLQGFKS